MTRKIIFISICAILVTMYIHTAVGKFINFDLFIKDMNNQPFPDSWTPIVTRVLPPLELAIAVSLFFDKTRLHGLYASLTLMSIFTIYSILVLLHVFSYVPCGCGGLLRSLKWPEHLVFDLFIMAINVWGIRIIKGDSSLNTQLISG